jgi:hypothetical protein
MFGATVKSTIDLAGIEPRAALLTHVSLVDVELAVHELILSVNDILAGSGEPDKIATIAQSVVSAVQSKRIEGLMETPKESAALLDLAEKAQGIALLAFEYTDRLRMFGTEFSGVRVSA